MGGEDRAVKLGDVTDLLTGYPFKSSDFTEARGDTRLLRGDNIVQGNLRWSGVKRLPRLVGAAFQDYMLAPGDVVLAMDRPWIEAGLKYAHITVEDCPSLLVQRVSRLRAKPDLDQRFLRYIIGSEQFTNYILGTQTGTAVPHISAAQIKAYEFRLPALIYQTRVADILSSLDDKIALNRRMAKTSEAIARALFQSWFVDFDPYQRTLAGKNSNLPASLAPLFPVNIGVRGMPDGWKLTPLSEMAVFLNGLPLQLYPATDNVPSLPVIKITEMRVGPKANSARATSALPSADYIVDDGDHIFSWSGSLTHCLWAYGRGALNQHLFKVIPKSTPAWLCYLAVDHFLPEFQAIALGKAVTMGHIQRHHLDEAVLPTPPPYVLEQFGKVISPLIDRVKALSFENRTLRALRGTLLSKLVSGQFHLADPETIPADA